MTLRYMSWSSRVPSSTPRRLLRLAVADEEEPMCADKRRVEKKSKDETVGDSAMASLSEWREKANSPSVRDSARERNGRRVPETTCVRERLTTLPCR